MGCLLFVIDDCWGRHGVMQLLSVIIFDFPSEVAVVLGALFAEQSAQANSGIASQAPAGK